MRTLTLCCGAFATFVLAASVAVAADGPDKASAGDGTTPLHYAVKKGDLAQVVQLLRTGANPNGANRYGVTPLSLAATNGNAVLISLLLKAGANPETPLPGGDMPGADFAAFLRALAAEFPFLPPELAQRYARLYGTRARPLLANARSLAALGACLGADLYEREVDFLRATEWASTADDILWRRTKTGLFLDREQRALLVRRIEGADAAA